MFSYPLIFHELILKAIAVIENKGTENGVRRYMHCKWVCAVLFEMKNKLHFYSESIK